MHKISPLKHTVDDSQLPHQLRLANYLIIYDGFFIHPTQLVFLTWFVSINSMTWLKLNLVDITFPIINTSPLKIGPPNTFAPNLGRFFLHRFPRIIATIMEHVIGIRFHVRLATLKKSSSISSFQQCSAVVCGKKNPNKEWWVLVVSGIRNPEKIGPKQKNMNCFSLRICSQKKIAHPKNHGISKNWWFGDPMRLDPPTKESHLGPLLFWEGPIAHADPSRIIAIILIIGNVTAILWPIIHSRPPEPPNWSSRWTDGDFTQTWDSFMKAFQRFGHSCWLYLHEPKMMIVYINIRYIFIFVVFIFVWYENCRFRFLSATNVTKSSPCFLSGPLEATKTCWVFQFEPSFSFYEKQSLCGWSKQ